MLKKIIVVFLVFAVVFSCSQEKEEVIVYFGNPAEDKGSEPNLHISESGQVFLTWIESKEKANSKLFFSILNEEELSWSSPRLIDEGPDWFINWADFPSLTSFGSNSLAVHYLDKSASDTYAYDVKIKISNNGGNSWSEPIIPHKDKTQTEHGFVSKIADKNDQILAIWLDGRKYAYAEKDSSFVKEMTLRSALVNQKGTLSQELELDDRVCDCCQTDAAMTQNGPIVVYRDRTANEIRDISYVRRIDDKWTEPKSIYDDSWSIFGCPVNGPSISTEDNHVAVAWFTAANDNPKVQVVFSDNNGESFGQPILVDQVKPSGRVDVEIMNDNSCIVSWLDNINELPVIQLQRIDSNGHKSSVITVTETSEERSSGFPRLVMEDSKVFMTWTNSGDNLTVSTAQINADSLRLSID